MSNDPNETTGARLTEYTTLSGKQVVGPGNVQQIWLVLADSERICVCYEAEDAERVRAALADRVALVAEIARLEAELAEEQRICEGRRRTIVAGLNTESHCSVLATSGDP